MHHYKHICSGQHINHKFLAVVTAQLHFHREADMSINTAWKQTNPLLHQLPKKDMINLSVAQNLSTNWQQCTKTGISSAGARKARMSSASCCLYWFTIGIQARMGSGLLTINLLTRFLMWLPDLSQEMLSFSVIRFVLLFRACYTLCCNCIFIL